MLAGTSKAVRRQKQGFIAAGELNLLGSLFLILLSFLNPCLLPTPRHFLRTSLSPVLPVASHYLPSLSAPFHTQETYIYFSPCVNQSSSILPDPYRQAQLWSPPSTNPNHTQHSVVEEKEDNCNKNTSFKKRKKKTQHTVATV